MPLREDPTLLQPRSVPHQFEFENFISTSHLDRPRNAGEALQRIEETSRTAAEKGRWFENLFSHIARNEPAFELSAIWRWTEWPDRKKRTGLDAKDIGVDLVCELHDGTLVAIQCKCYERRKRIAKEDLTKFIAGSQHEAFGLRWIVTTSRWGPTAEAMLKGSNIRRIDFREYADRPLAQDVERPQREPRALQKEAIGDTIAGLERHDRGRTIMACGTGKTFVALRVAETLVPDGATILFCAPSIALVSQARREWLEHTRRPLSSVVVCSDPSAGQNNAEDISISELECPVESNPETIARRLRTGTQTKVVFGTYQSLRQVCKAQSEYGADAFALTIADEAHRTTGVVGIVDAKVDFQRVHDPIQLKSVIITTKDETS